MRTSRKKTPLILFFFTVFLFLALLMESGWASSSKHSETTIVPFPILINPTSIKIYSDKIIIMEEDSVSIFSMEDFKLLQKIGRRGEGPGEFKNPPYVIPMSEQLLILNYNKVFIFSYTGELLEEEKIPFAYNYGFFPLLPVKENYVGFPLEMIEGEGFGHIGRLYDNKFQSIKKIYERVPLLIPPPPPPPRPGETSLSIPKQDFETIPDCIDLAVEEDNIYIADSRKGFNISVFNSQGELLFEIDRKYEKIKVPKKFAEAYMKELQDQSNWQRLKNRFNYVFKDFFPAFFSLKVDHEKMYALTYAQKDGLYEIVELDLKGNFLNRTFTFPLQPFSRLNDTFLLFGNEFDIYSDKIYYLGYNFEREWIELHITPLK